ncbi:hypothetical protein [Limosilactobacillus fermentum]|nr:hypothetical protein [uncultured Limosilactobacillus sp.]
MTISQLRGGTYERYHFSLAANGQIARLVEERLLTEPIFKDV